MGEYALSIADIEHVLALNPRHFGALAGLAVMLERWANPISRCGAFRAVAGTSIPTGPASTKPSTRLERMTGAVEL